MDTIPVFDWAAVKQYRLGSLPSTDIFLTILATGNSSSGHQLGWVRALFQVADFLLYLNMVEGEASSLGSLL